MLGLAASRQVGVNRRHQRTLVAEVDLDLAQVLTLFEQMRRVGMAQGVEMSCLFYPAGFKRQTEGPLQRGAAHGFGGRWCAPAAVAFGRKEQRGMTMGF